jgi:hypothetical protein
MVDGWQRAGGVKPLRGAGAAVRGLLLALAAFAATAASAHNLGDSYLYLQIYEDTVTGRFEIALSDLNPALGLDGTAREITAENLEESIGFLRRYYLEHVTIADDGGPLSIDFTDYDVLDAQGGFLRLPFELGGLDVVPEALTIDYSVLFDEEPSHRGFLLVEHNWATGTFANENRVSLVFSPSSRSQRFDLTSSGRLRGFVAVARLGAEHLLLGVDHVMFLLALLLPLALRRKAGAWRPVESFRPALRHALTVASAFLVAHSVALSLAAMDMVRLPESLVETAIAGSTTLAAIHLLWPIFRRFVWWIIFGLSLFHGFGFAAGLRDLGVLEDHLGLSILAFNLGAEVGQIALVAVLTPMLFLVRRLRLYSRLLLPVAAVGMILVSGVWVIERAFGVDIPLRELLPGAVQRVLP